MYEARQNMEKVNRRVESHKLPYRTTLQEKKECKNNDGLISKKYFTKILQKNDIDKLLDSGLKEKKDKNSINIDINENISDSIFDKVQLVHGSKRGTEHYELIFLQKDDSDNCLRISRNNISDTIQYPASIDQSKQSYGSIKSEYDISVCGNKIIEAFNKVHNSFPYYINADCECFAENIYNEVTGENSYNADLDFI